MPLLRTLLLNGTLGLAGYWTARHGFRMPPGLPRGLAAVTIAWAWATLGMEILGPPGFLAYGPLLAWTLAGLAVAIVLRLRDPGGRGDAAVAALADAGPGEPWDLATRLALGLVLWTTLMHGLSSLLGPVKVVSDGPIYHLYFAARWWKAGRLFLVAAPFGESVVTYFPAVGDLWFAWLLVGWDGDRPARAGQLPFLLVAGLAAYACARRLGAGASSSVIATSWFASVVPFLLFSIVPNVDTILVAAYLLGAYFFLRYALGDEGAGALALGAVATGGVLGMKPSGFVFGGLLLGAAALAVLLRRTSWRRTLCHLALLAALPLLMSGYWYAQNLLLTGNPLYPLHLSALGRVWLSGWYGSDVMRMSPYYIPVGDWRSFVDILCAVFDPRLLPIWGGALAGAWASPGGRRPLDRWVWAFSALAVANVAAYWLLVPYRTQQRFMLQACGLMVVPLARTFDRGRWLRLAGAVLLAVHLMTSASWPFGPADREPPWDLSGRVPNVVPPLLTLPALDTLSRGGRVEPEELYWTAAQLAIGLGSWAAASAWGRAGPRAGRRAWLASLASLVVGILLLYPYRADRRALFFPPFRDYYRGWLQLDARSGPSGSRIAYAGTNVPYYLMGVDLRNDVRYVNVDARPGWLLHDYHRLARSRGESTWPNPWPNWDRRDADYDAWLANLRSEGIQLLVVASRNHPPGELPDADDEGFPIERRWADAHPEAFEPLYGVAERDPKFRIYRVRPGRR